MTMPQNAHITLGLSWGPKTERTACRRTHRAVKASSGAMVAPHCMQNPPRISVQNSHGEGQAWLLSQPGTTRAAVAICCWFEFASC